MAKKATPKKTVDQKPAEKDPFYDFESHGRWWEQGNSNYQEMFGTPNTIHVNY